MKVLSELAKIEFSVGEINYAGKQLIIESDPDSTMSTQILVSHSDARKTIVQFLKSGGFWRFLLSLPFSGSKQSRSLSDDSSKKGKWAKRRKRIALNKPW